MIHVHGVVDGVVQLLGLVHARHHCLHAGMHLGFLKGRVRRKPQVVAAADVYGQELLAECLQVQVRVHFDGIPRLGEVEVRCKRLVGEECMQVLLEPGEIRRKGISA